MAEKKTRKGGGGKLSRSETVTDALLHARPPWVGVAESRPGGEGRVVADTLRETGIPVALVPDAAIATALVSFQVEVILVGADAILPSGAVVNRSTRPQRSPSNHRA